LFIGATEESADVRKGYPDVHWMAQEDLLNSSDVIFVESAVRDHARHALAALRAGKNIHLEKPPSVQYREMVEITQVARQRNLLLQCGYMWRYHAGFQAIFQAVRQDWLGEIYQVRGTMNNLLPSSERAAWAEFKGGAFFELAAHLVDALIRLIGKPVKVSPFLSSTNRDELVDNNVAVFEFERAIGIITNSTNQPNANAHRSFEVLGKNGTMILKPIEQPALHLDLKQAAGPYKSGPQSIPLPNYTRYAADIDELAAALRGDRQLTVSLAEELLVHEWLLKATGMFSDI
jgi:predicted dehydrogenase